MAPESPPSNASNEVKIAIVGKTPSCFEGANANIYEFAPFKEILVAKLYPTTNIVCVSLFVQRIDSPCTLRVTLVGPYSSQTSDFKISKSWHRISIAMRNDISMQPLEVKFQALTIASEKVCVAIDGFQLDEALYALSPLGQGPALPYLGAPTDIGEHIQASKVLLEQRPPITSKAATVIVVATPNWETAEITERDFKTFFSLWSGEKSLEISIGVSGKNQSRFSIRVREKGEESIFCSDLIAGRQEYFVCAVCSNGRLSLIINGYVTLGINLPDLTLFDEVGFGCTRRENGGHLGGYFKQYLAYGVPFPMRRILSLYKTLCPTHSHYFLDYIDRFLHIALPEEDEAETFNFLQVRDSFAHFIDQMSFALPKIYEQFPPTQKFLEENVRDHVSALLTRPKSDPIRERYSKIGRTDLVVSYPTADGERGDSYPIEFKFWGAKGWRELPEQPLKYMGESEKFGVTVMIDRRKTPDQNAYEDIIRNNKEYPCSGVFRFNLLDTDLHHFFSFHRDRRYRSPRMLANFYISIPDKTRRP